MKIVGISAMHGIYEGFTIPKADILSICGDIVPLKYQNYIKLSDEWFINEFIPWCCKQPVEQVYLVGGNHDKFLMNRNLILVYIVAIILLLVVGLLEEILLQIGIIFLLILIIGIKISYICT